MTAIDERVLIPAQRTGGRCPVHHGPLSACPEAPAELADVLAELYPSVVVHIHDENRVELAEFCESDTCRQDRDHGTATPDPVAVAVLWLLARDPYHPSGRVGQWQTESLCAACLPVQARYWTGRGCWLWVQIPAAEAVAA